MATSAQATRPTLLLIETRTGRLWRFVGNGRGRLAAQGWEITDGSAWPALGTPGQRALLERVRRTGIYGWETPAQR